MSNDNMTQFINELHRLADEHKLKLSHSDIDISEHVFVRFRTESGEIFGQIVVMKENVLNSAFPATYARSLFRQMMKKCEGEETE